MTHWHRVRDWARRRRSTHLVLRGVVLVVGGTLLAAGAAMLVLPGPGLLVMVLGLLVLASEFGWAHRLLDRARGALATARTTTHPKRFEPTLDRGGRR